MITIPLTTEDLTKVRIAPSPLWETVQSVGVLLHQGRDTPHAPWAARAKRGLPGTELSALVAAMCVEGHCPAFLSPRPASATVGFDEELERVRYTSPEVVVDQVRVIIQQEKDILRRLHPEQERMLRTLLGDPEDSVRRLVDALRRYHELAISPYWPRIREHLEGDTLKRGQAFALGGAEVLLSGLHPKVGYNEGTIELDKPYEGVLEPAGQGITLVPSVFSWPRALVLAHPHSQPTLAYVPRGVASLWTSSPPKSSGTALEAALGAGRASVMKGLLVPRTTTELAYQLRLSPAAVSAHLSRLKAAELIEPHRSGRRVYYRLSCAGESLLGIFKETG
jgi:DNA-binding transcriptional ArsR family regulator